MGGVVIVQTVFTVLVIVSHIAFMVMEMFLWMHPVVRKIFGMSVEKAENAKVLAGNMGLYNGFLAAGLLWGLWTQKTDVLIFFLGCVVVAGFYGGLTAKRSIIVIQAAPALIALGLTYYYRNL